MKIQSAQTQALVGSFLPPNETPPPVSLGHHDGSPETRRDKLVKIIEKALEIVDEDSDFEFSDSTAPQSVQSHQQ